MSQARISQRNGFSPDTCAVGGILTKSRSGSGVIKFSTSDVKRSVLLMNVISTQDLSK